MKIFGPQLFTDSSERATLILSKRRALWCTYIRSCCDRCLCQETDFVYRPLWSGQTLLWSLSVPGIRDSVYRPLWSGQILLWSLSVPGIRDSVYRPLWSGQIAMFVQLDQHQGAHPAFQRRQTEPGQPTNKRQHVTWRGYSAWGLESRGQASCTSPSWAEMSHWRAVCFVSTEHREGTKHFLLYLMMLTSALISSSRQWSWCENWELC